MAAAVPVVPVALNNNAALPAAVLDGLLSRHKFTPTRFTGEPEVLSWPEQDHQFRCQPVHCTGYVSAHNGDGTVYVNGAILSMLSESPVLEFDCAKETFNTVMTFVHSMRRGNLTIEQLLELLPPVRECKLPYLFDALAVCVVVNSGVPLREAFNVGLETESFLLIEYCLLHLDYAVHVGHLMNAARNVFRTRPISAFVAEVSARVAELLTILPPYVVLDVAADPRLAEFHAKYHALYASTFAQINARIHNAREAAPIWDVSLTFEEGKEVFASRAILAHASRFFYETFFGGCFVLTEQCLVPVEDVERSDFVRLFEMHLPTFYGLLWRVTASAPATEDEQELRTARCASMYRYVFVSDAENMLRVFKLAVYYQIPGLIDFLIDVVVHCLPWRQRLRFADSVKSREIMASLLTPQTAEEMRSSEDHLDDISQPTKNLLIEYFAHLFAF